MNTSLCACAVSVRPDARGADGGSVEAWRAVLTGDEHTPSSPGDVLPFSCEGSDGDFARLLPLGDASDLCSL